jgi:hypothetical protein
VLAIRNSSDSNRSCDWGDSFILERLSTPLFISQSFMNSTQNMRDPTNARKARESTSYRTPCSELLQHRQFESRFQLRSRAGNFLDIQRIARVSLLTQVRLRRDSGNSREFSSCALRRSRRSDVMLNR